MKDFPYTDQDILNELKQSNHRFFESFFRFYHKELFHYAIKYLKQAQLAEEIIQDCFAEIWEKRKQLHIHSSVKAYLYTMVKHKTLNLLKSPSFKHMVLEHKHITTDSIEDEMIRAELGPILNQAIAQLPEKCKEIFILSKQRGFTYAEIAKELNISEKTVENQIGIAYKKLRISLKDLFAIIALYFF